MIAEPSYYVGRPVESMQTMLRFAAEGNNRLLPVVPDGVFGPNTMAAVTAFQRCPGSINTFFDTLSCVKMNPIFPSTSVASTLSSFS